ncbi:MAG: phage tail assembly protein [Eubacterium sp.]|nr:phage tail assembly protein [Eubacterium sp.]
MEADKKNTDRMEINQEDDLVIRLKKPITFEGERYETIDLSGLNEVKASDMVTVSRRMARNGSNYVTSETTLEYALNMANIVTGLPLEFFDQLPPYAAMAIRNSVVAFLFRQE